MDEKTHLTRDDIKYVVNPIGNLIPDFIGQYCIAIDDRLYIAKGLTSYDWVGVNPDMKIYTEIEELNALNIELSQKISILKERASVLEEKLEG